LIVRRAWLLLMLLCPTLAQAGPWAWNSVSVDVPLDGGAMVSYNRTWDVTKFMDVGFVVSGGQIRRTFDLDGPAGQTYHATTDALVLPLAGPFVTLHASWIGISVGYGAFWAKTDLSVRDVPGGTAMGKTNGWGTGIYSPLLVLDFYDQKRDMIFGFGIGGYFGSSYKTLSASNPSGAITTNASPLDTLTFHLHCRWADGRWIRAASEQTNPF
jgi:hypothetical protein